MKTNYDFEFLLVNRCICVITSAKRSNVPSIECHLLSNWLEVTGNYYVWNLIGFRYKVITGSLMRLVFSQNFEIWPIYFHTNVFTALKGTHFCIFIRLSLVLVTIVSSVLQRF